MQRTEAWALDVQDKLFLFCFCSLPTPPSRPLTSPDSERAFRVLQVLRVSLQSPLTSPDSQVSRSYLYLGGFSSTESASSSRFR